MSYTDQDFEQTAASHTPGPESSIHDELSEVLANAWQYDDDAEQDDGPWAISDADTDRLLDLLPRLEFEANIKQELIEAAQLALALLAEFPSRDPGWERSDSLRALIARATGRPE